MSCPEEDAGIGAIVFVHTSEGRGYFNSRPFPRVARPYSVRFVLLYTHLLSVICLSFDSFASILLRSFTLHLATIR
jgi:hypothetical protein